MGFPGNQKELLHLCFVSTERLRQELKNAHLFAIAEKLTNL
jgi:hypothetical protein